MDINEIRKLILLMDEAGLAELEIEDRAGKVRLVRDRDRRRDRGNSSGADPGNPGDPSLDLEPGGEEASAERPDSRAARVDHPRHRALPGTSEITSPMVGTFYRAPASEAPPFVEVGDLVQVGQVVCIIEAMKMMNEIHSEVAGRVLSVVAENGNPVEYGSPLFVVELGD